MPWRSQFYLEAGRVRGVDELAMKNAVSTAQELWATSPGLPPILSLRHLAELSQVDYGVLRKAVGRKLSSDYTVFRVKKRRQGEYRMICVPCDPILRVQQWIARNVLRSTTVHEASFAYARESRISDAAVAHAGARWLIKLDVRRFFESISEIAVYRVFRCLGYQPLVSFELSRLSTRTGGKSRGDSDRWNQYFRSGSVISSYFSRTVGHLPQGAPTSPMLSNHAARALDERIADLAKHYGLRYSRYADDIALSSVETSFGRDRAAMVVTAVYRAMSQCGFSPNTSKTQIIPPSARKVVLGLLVDTDRPRLPREFRDRLRQHCYYLRHPKIGPAHHAVSRGFASVVGLRNHVYGLLSFAQSIDPEFADSVRGELSLVTWPL
jgi:RNA-directed DNA polymerase